MTAKSPGDEAEIEQRDAVAELGDGRREVGGDDRLAHAAAGRDDRDDERLALDAGRARVFLSNFSWARGAAVASTLAISAGGMRPDQHVAQLELQQVLPDLAALGAFQRRDDVDVGRLLAHLVDEIEPGHVAEVQPDDEHARMAGQDRGGGEKAFPARLGLAGQRHVRAGLDGAADGRATLRVIVDDKDIDHGSVEFGVRPVWRNRCHSSDGRCVVLVRRRGGRAGCGGGAGAGKGASEGGSRVGFIAPMTCGRRRLAGPASSVTGRRDGTWCRARARCRWCSHRCRAPRRRRRGRPPSRWRLRVLRVLAVMIHRELVGIVGLAVVRHRLDDRHLALFARQVLHFRDRPAWGSASCRDRACARCAA